MSYTWQVVIAAGALNCELVPVDALTFCEFYDRRRTSFREWLTIAFVKEPQATTMFEHELSKLQDELSKQEEALRRAWMRVIERAVDEGQDREALRNLTRQGTARFSCFARVMTKIGAIERVKARSGPSTAAGNIFTLGLDKNRYRFCTDHSKFHDFYDALEPANAQWQKFLQETEGKPLDLSSVCRSVRSTLEVAGDARPAFGMKTQGYL